MNTAKSPLVLLALSLLCINPVAAKQNPSLSGVWKTNCNEPYGILIQKAATPELYTVSFCGPGGCSKPGTWRPKSTIYGDDDYEVISPTSLKLRSTEGWTNYTQCKALPDDIDPFDSPTRTQFQSGCSDEPDSLMSFVWMIGSAEEPDFLWVSDREFQISITRDKLLNILGARLTLYSEKGIPADGLRQLLQEVEEANIQMGSINLFELGPDTSDLETAKESWKQAADKTGENYLESRYFSLMSHAQEIEEALSIALMTGAATITDAGGDHVLAYQQQHFHGDTSDGGATVDSVRFSTVSDKEIYTTCMITPDK